MDPVAFMKTVTRENAAEGLAALSGEDRSYFEWWFVMKYGDRIPCPEQRRRVITLGSDGGGFEPTTDTQSAYGAMHRAILASREPQ